MDHDMPEIPSNARAENVRRRLGRPWQSDDEESLTEDLLDDAWDYLLTDVPTIEDRLASEPRLAQQAGKVLVAAVTRVVRNPEGWRQVGLDDFQGTRDTVLSAGLLQFTPDELARLQPKQGSLAGVYMMPLSVPYWEGE